MKRIETEYISKLLSLIERKSTIDKESAWSEGSATYFCELGKEIEEVREELESGRQCYLEDELGDVLWDYLNLLYNLEDEGKISLSGVFRRASRKYDERITTIANGGSWASIKEKQKIRLANEQKADRYEEDDGVEAYWNPLVPELQVSRFAESLSFYTEVIGFDIRFQRSSPDFAYLELDQVQMMLEQQNDDGWKVGHLERPFGRGINFQIEVPDVQTVYKRVQDAGWLIYRELEENWYEVETFLMGQKEFLIQDPDGYLLRFSQDLGARPKEVNP